MRLRLVDLDGDESLASTAAAFGADAQRIDCRDLARRLRLWATRRAMAAFAARLTRAGEPTGTGPVLTLLGSGDYHHLNAVLLAQVHEPFTVIHFDNHPDWVRLAPRHHCGSWVNRALELPNVTRIATIGPCSDDLVWPEFKGGNLAALESGRLELYPWRHEPSTVLRHFRPSPCFQQNGHRLFWRTVGGEAWPGFIDELRSRIPTDAIWFSIDKDVLRPADAATNWDQGEMPLEALLDGIRTFSKGKRVLGADLCGDYSPPAFGWNVFKRIESWQDHPAALDQATCERNAGITRLIADTLREALT
jgi:arginase family enzyme